MRYILGKNILGFTPEIEITEEQYNKYKESQLVLTNCLEIEEKYEILISNYLQFEKNILFTTATYMVRAQIDYSDFFDIRLSLNISLVNLLTSARLYIDQLHHHFKVCCPTVSKTKMIIKNLFSKEYDENSEYRFMEALRNYVQHRGIAVHSTTSGGMRRDPDNSLEYSLELSTLKSMLEEDGEFKKQVLNECPEKIDLKKTTRSYIESLSKVHESVRELIQKSVEASRMDVEETHRQYAKIYNESLVGLSALLINDQKIVESIPLLLDWDNIRIKLQKRNLKLINLKNRFVTSKLQTS